MMMKYIPLIIVIGLTACKNDRGNQSSSSESVLDMSDVLSIISKSEGWTTTFVSRGGNFLGKDSDSQISFYDDGRVSMTEYGYSPITYNGTYAMADDGKITLDLESYPGKWPVMVIRKMDEKIFLFRADGADEMEFGGRGGAIETSDMKPFWPFGLSAVTWPGVERFKIDGDSDSEHEPLLPAGEE